MDKSILSQYRASETIIQQTERQIKRLKEAKENVLSDTVSGSNPNFPYEPVTFRIEGYGSAAYYNDAQIKELELLLTERRKIAADLRLRVEAWLNTLPPRIQLIVHTKFVVGATWEEVARRVGGNSTPDGVRMEYSRFMEGEMEGDRNIS